MSDTPPNSAGPQVPYRPPLPTPGAAPPYGAPGQVAPPQYGAPVAPPSPSGVPASPYLVPGQIAPGPTMPAPQTRTGRSTLGVVALLVAAVGLLVATIAAGVAGVLTGPGFAEALDNRPSGGDLDLTYLSPVRGWVLLGEIAFWVGTATGICAIVQGAIAIASRRGRGAGIAAIIVAALGPAVFAVVVVLTMATGVGMAA